MYDLIIIGAGPAGLTASIYASCFHLKHLIIGEQLGGQMVLAPDILNYPGFEEITGKELTEKIVEQVKKRGGELVIESVTRIISRSNGIHDAVDAHLSQTTSGQSSNNPINTNKNVILSTFDKLSVNEAKNPVGNSEDIVDPSATPQDDIVSGDFFRVETQEGNKYKTKAIILATGTERRKLNVLGEIEYTGRGVHYCVTCEKFDYDGKVCAVVGGANSAVQAAVELSQAAAKVYIIHRGRELRGDPIWIEQVEKSPKIEVIYSSVVTEIVGDGEKVIHVILNTFDKLSVNSVQNPVGNSENVRDPSSRRDVEIQDDKKLLLDKLFIEIGGVPGTALVIPLGVEMDTGGYIKVNERLATNIAGIFAAGDLISYALSIEQISSAVGLGARAAASAFAFLKQEKAPIVWGGSKIKR